MKRKTHILSKEQALNTKDFLSWPKVWHYPYKHDQFALISRKFFRRTSVSSYERQQSAIKEYDQYIRPKRKRITCPLNVGIIQILLMVKDHGRSCISVINNI